ncbi:hypothetical protein [Herbiconiux sp. UC225_62]|uniref:hypothetical protein n=1 Tax=Herbiconiux sp. UC225_62 TaxID=3350168 RepID=UPI0036D35472
MLDNHRVSQKPVARIYVDGFNLSRRSLQSKPEFKWLDLVAPTLLLMPDHRIDHVHYFTTHLGPGLLADTQSPVRQQMYLLALEAHPDVSIHFTDGKGTFHCPPKWS